MSTVAGIASTREYNSTTLTWSEVDNFIYNLCANNNLPIHSLCADKGFEGVSLHIRIPHCDTFLFPSNAWQLREIVVMKNIFTQIE